MADFLVWPKKVLRIGEAEFTKSARNRSGGQSLSSFEQTTKTDTGLWKAKLTGITLTSNAAWKCWRAIGTELGGRSGVIAVPSPVRKTAPYPNDTYGKAALNHFADGASFSDGGLYRTRYITLKTASAATLGSTVISIQAENAGDDLTGIRFSYQFALYETGSIISKSGDVWQMRVFPAIRQTIPAGADLEADDPMCLMHLVEDEGMTVPEGGSPLAFPDVELIEAVDYWVKLAKEA